MNHETGDYILADFFEENKISTHKIKASVQTESHLESIVGALASS